MLRTLVLAAVAAACAAAEIDQSYIDLRVGGGLRAGGGYGGAVTLMGTALTADALSEGTASSTDATDFGLAVGFRGEADHVAPRLDGQASRLNALGWALVGGLAFRIGHHVSIETLYVYGRGLIDAREIDSSSPLHQDGDYKLSGGELGGYWTFDARYQIGVTVGFSKYTVAPKGAADDLRASGVDVGVVGGYRF